MPSTQTGGVATSDVAALDLGPALARGGAAKTSDFATRTVRRPGPSENRLDIVFLGEGYRQSELDKYHADVDRVVARMLAVEPYRSFADLFNVHLIDVVSEDSGIDDPSAGVERDTALDLTFGTGSLERCVGTSSEAKVYAAAEAVPEYDQILVIANDSKYDGGGDPFACFTASETSAKTAIHEFGHAFARLADEYGGAKKHAPIQEAPQANVTTAASRSELAAFGKWDYWIPRGQPLTTPDSASVVGLYEGAYLTDHEVFRPYRDCRMRTFAVDFCPICREQHVLHLYSYASPIDAVIPALEDADLPIGIGEEATLRGVVVHPTGATATARWLVDGVETATGETLSASGSALGLGEHVVTFEVSEQTRYVRRDPSALLEASRSVRVVVGDMSGRPVAAAVEDARVEAGTRIRLDGTASTGAGLDFLWVQTAGMPVELDDPYSATPSFTAPETSATISFDLVVASAGLESLPDPVKVTTFSVPVVTKVTAKGAKRLVVVESGFAAGSTIVVEGVAVSDTIGVAGHGDRRLSSQSALGLIASGRTPTIRVRNPDGVESSVLTFTRRGVFDAAYFGSACAIAGTAQRAGSVVGLRANRRKAGSLQHES